MEQKIFEYNIPSKTTLEDFYVSEANKDAYNYVINDNEFSNYSIIYGPVKSGKTHLGSIWQKKITPIFIVKKIIKLLLITKKMFLLMIFLIILTKKFYSI